MKLNIKSPPIPPHLLRFTPCTRPGVVEGFLLFFSGSRGEGGGGGAERGFWQREKGLLQRASNRPRAVPLMGAGLVASHHGLAFTSVMVDWLVEMP